MTHPPTQKGEHTHFFNRYADCPCGEKNPWNTPPHQNQEEQEISRDEANRLVAKGTGKWLPDGLAPTPEEHDCEACKWRESEDLREKIEEIVRSSLLYGDVSAEFDPEVAGQQSKELIDRLSSAHQQWVDEVVGKLEELKRIDCNHEDMGVSVSGNNVCKKCGWPQDETMTDINTSHNHAIDAAISVIKETKI